MTLDELKAKHPALGFAVFALDPADPVSFEVYTPAGETFTWQADTVQGAIDKAFPPAPPAAPPPSFFD